jgi:hypothetical protein
MKEMKMTHQMHNLIILDESGSMDSIKSSIIKGFNKLVKSIKDIEKEIKDQEHFITLVSFNGSGIKLLHFIDFVKSLNSINHKKYNPDDNTPLYDAIGYSVNKLKMYLEGKSDFNVIVSVFTDGEENASTEFNTIVIKKIIEDLIGSDKWIFTYLGTGHDVLQSANEISIHNFLEFDRSDKGIKNMFNKDRKARMKHCLRISMNDNTTPNGYFDED